MKFLPFLNSSIDQANAFQMMRTILLQTIQHNKQLNLEITRQGKTITMQQKELLKFKGKEADKDD
jgi:hypothetical protein